MAVKGDYLYACYGGNKYKKYNKNTLEYLGLITLTKGTAAYCPTGFGGHGLVFDDEGYAYSQQCIAQGGVPQGVYKFNMETGECIWFYDGSVIPGGQFKGSLSVPGDGYVYTHGLKLDASDGSLISSGNWWAFASLAIDLTEDKLFTPQKVYRWSTGEVLVDDSAQFGNSDHLAGWTFWSILNGDSSLDKTNHKVVCFTLAKDNSHPGLGLYDYDYNLLGYSSSSTILYRETTAQHLEGTSLGGSVGCIDGKNIYAFEYALIDGSWARYIIRINTDDCENRFAVSWHDFGSQVIIKNVIRTKMILIIFFTFLLFKI